MSDHAIGSLGDDSDAETSDKKSQAMTTVLSSGKGLSLLHLHIRVHRSQ